MKPARPRPAGAFAFAGLDERWTQVIGPAGIAGVGASRLRPSVTIAGGGGGQPTPTYASDWGTAAGTTDNALSDGGKWDSFMGPTYSDYLEVVAATTGFPAAMTNVLRVKMPGRANGQVKVTTGWSAPAVGSYLFERIYFKLTDATTSGWGALHWFQPNSIGPNMPISYQWEIWPPTAGGKHEMVWHLVNQAETANPHYFTIGDLLDVNSVYRLESRLQRTATLTAKVDLRIYAGDSETALYDDTDFNDDDNPGETLSSQDPTVELEDVIQLSTLELGNNGPDNSTHTTSNLFEVGGFAVVVSSSASDWPGPYQSGEAA